MQRFHDISCILLPQEEGLHIQNDDHHSYNAYGITEEHYGMESLQQFSSSGKNDKSTIISNN